MGLGNETEGTQNIQFNKHIGNLFATRLSTFILVGTTLVLPWCTLSVITLTL